MEGSEAVVAEGEGGIAMLDLTKPVTTKDGRKVRIFCTDGGGPWPIIGAIEYPEGNPNWLVGRWTPEGRWSNYSPKTADLINHPRPRIKVTTYLHLLTGGRVWANEVPRPLTLGLLAIHTVYIDIEEGVGL